MPTIVKGDRPMTAINVFTVAPEHQAHLIDLLRRATESTIRHAPGFIAAALHRSLDGTKVTMYAQWRTPEDYARHAGTPGCIAILGGGFDDCSLRPRLLRSD